MDGTAKPKKRRGPGRPFGPDNLPTANPISRAASRMRQAIYRNLTREQADRIAKALFREAESGNVTAIREVFDRTWGKAIQPVDVTVHEERTIAVIAMTEAQIVKLQEFNAETRASLGQPPKLINSTSNPTHEMIEASPTSGPAESSTAPDQARPADSIDSDG